MPLKREGLALVNSIIMMWHSVWSQSVSGKRGRNESWKLHFFLYCTLIALDFRVVVPRIPKVQDMADSYAHFQFQSLRLYQEIGKKVYMKTLWPSG